MKKIILLFFIVITLTACSGVGNKTNIINLLSAPKLSQTENDIVKAIDTYLGENIVLKYSNTMGYSAPVQIMDVDDDGESEAFVLYYAPNKGTNIRLALLENIGGKWTIVFDKEGLGSEVFHFTITRLSATAQKQVLVGYSNPTTEDKFIAVYFLDSETEAEVYSERCNQVIVGDLTGDGYDDITLAVKAPDNRTKISVLSLGEDNLFATVGTHYLKAANIQITQLAISKVDGKKNALYIDYKDAYKKTYTEAGVFNGSILERILPAVTIAKVWEYSFDLNSTDMDADGTLEIPTVIQEDVQDELPVLKFIEWTDYSKGEQDRKYFGVCDTKTGLFIAAPDEWQEQISLLYEEKSWSITRLDDGTGLVRIKPMQVGSVPDVSDKEIVTVKIGTRRWQIEFSDDVSKEQREYMIGSMTTLD